MDLAHAARVLLESNETSVNPLELPAAFVYNCAHCRRTERETSLKTCTACQAIKYCSVACQKADWKTHKPECEERRAAAEALAAAGVTFVQQRLKSYKVNAPRLFAEAVAPSEAVTPAAPRLAWAQEVARGGVGAPPPSPCASCARTVTLRTFETVDHVRAYVTSGTCAACQA